MVEVSPVERVPRAGILSGGQVIRGSVLFGLCLALIFSSYLFPAEASAHTRTFGMDGPALQMVVGFDDGSGVGDSRVNYWTPVQVTLSNSGANFTGTLSATTFTNSGPFGVVPGIPWSYQEVITLPRGTQKQITMYVPFYENPTEPRGIVATLRDSHGKVILTQSQTTYALREEALFVGILSSDQSTSFDPLRTVRLPDPSRTIETVLLNANTMPDMAEMLGNFDVIVLDDFTTSTLNANQLAALETWVNQGGALIEVGGPQWQGTLAALPPELVPVAIHGTATLPAGTHLLPTGNPTIADTGQHPAPDTTQQSLMISTATIPGSGESRQRSLSNIETVLASGTTPLIVQAHQGQGVICYLAFDPAVEPTVSWPGAIALWKGLLFRTLGDQALIPDTVPRYSNGPGQLTLRNGLFQILQPPGTSLAAWELVLLLLGYLVLIGPVRIVILKRLKRPNWSWRIVLSGIVAFSLLTYGLALYQRAPTINSISIIQFNQGGSQAHVTTYFSVFIPGQGNFQVHLPARSLAQLISDAQFQNDQGSSNEEENTTITLGQHETNVNLADIGIWTLHALVSEQDQRLQSGIVSHLILQNNTLVGSVTNTLNSPLSDVYVLMSHSFAHIGNLAAGQTRQIHSPLHSSTPDSGTTLVDQIARNNGLPVPYFPYAHGAQPQTNFQRHIAILSALSGEGYSFLPCSGPCSTHAIVSKHTIITPSFGSPKLNPLDNSDPLLLAGAPATLIGWSDSPVDSIHAVTVNGVTPGGTHETFVQVPFNINLSGSLNLPPDLMSGQVINAQGNGIQTTLPSVYSVSTGSITFEFTLPNTTNLQISNMTITEPFLKQSTNISHVQIRLYNWSTGSWDRIDRPQGHPVRGTGMQNYTFTTANIKAYTSSDGRVLLQIANQDISPGVLIFSKPSLSLDGTVSGP